MLISLVVATVLFALGWVCMYYADNLWAKDCGASRATEVLACAFFAVCAGVLQSSHNFIV